MQAILPKRGLDGLVGHLDGLREGQAPELLPTRGWTGSCRRRPTPRSPSASVRRPPTRKACDDDRGQGASATPTTPPTRPTPTDLVLDDADRAAASTAAPTSVHRTTRLDPGLDRDQGLTSTVRRDGPSASAAPAGLGDLGRSPAPRRLQPVGRCCRAAGWLGVAYLGSLVVLFITAFWTLNDFTGLIVKRVRRSTTSGRSVTRAGLPQRSPCGRWRWRRS